MLSSLTLRPFAMAARIAIVLAVIAPRSALAIGPHHSFDQLPTGNGFGFATYDAQAARLTFFTDHPYVQPDANTSTHALAYDAYFGVRASGAGGWLGEMPVSAVEYVDQTNVVHATQSFGPLQAETYVFSPWGIHAPAVVLALHVTNPSRITVSDGAAYVLLNFHVGSGIPPGTDGEHITWDGTSYSETGPSGVTLRYLPFTPPTHHGATPNNPYPIVREGGSLIDVSDSGTTNDAVAGYQWTLSPLGPGADTWVGVVVTTGTASDATGWMNGRTAGAAVTDEVTQWNAWRTPPPAGLSDTESRVWRQSESVIRMAQSREPAPSGGQIVAALPPGIWWISWVRDMSYATAALARAGHTAEASSAVDFMLGGQVGSYQSYVGVPYHVSVVRYYGNGTEWSDSNANGPNIEFDGFGLSTWAAQLAGRHDLDTNGSTLSALVDPGTGLIGRDSSIWEVHWNGQQKHFGYTSIAGAQALCLTGNAAAAQSVRDAIVQHLILPQGGLAGNLEELETGAGALDAAVVEAINFGLIDPHGALATDTIQAFEGLRTPVNRGYMRNDDGGGYDMQEWIFIDMRIASALIRMGRTAEAQELIAWVTDQADDNMDLVPELFHRDDADYQGSIPMVGFGAGAYMLALLDRAQLPAANTTCFPPEHYTGGSHGPHFDGGVGDSGNVGPTTDTGCSVVRGVGRAGGVAPVAWLALGVALMGARRRRGLAACAVLLLAACNGNGGSGDAGTDGATRPDAPPSVQGLPVRDCTANFVYPLGHGASSVAVAGQWNQFSSSANPMSDGLGTGTYRTSLALAPGSYGYKFVADGNWVEDPTRGLTAYVGGVENSRWIVPDCTFPALQVTSAQVMEDRTIAVDLQYLDGTLRAGMNASSFTVLMNRVALQTSAITVDPTTARISLRVPTTANDKYTFRINVTDAGGRAADELVVPMWVEDQPYHWGDGPMYFAFTDRFRNGNPANDTPIPSVDARANYQGGDLAGVLAALQEGYFDQLGVKAIWISPVNDNTQNAGAGSDGHAYSGYHGYWVDAPRTIEEHWGTMDDLRAVTAEAHRHGIRIVLDVVHNQLHQDHPYFHMHPDWFNGDGSCQCGGPNCDWNSHLLECWFAPYLPDVNWTNMATVDQMISDALWWAVEADVDGFRVDAVKHMQDIASTTLRLRLHDTLETGNAQFYLVGETFSGEGDRPLVSHYVNANELWGQFDFPLFWTIRSAFGQNQGTMGDVDAAVQASAQAYGTGIMSPFLGNHDVERFVSLAANQLTGGTQAWDSPPPQPDTDDPYNRLFLAFVFTLTQPGVPLIYYGDEIGMAGAADPDNRRMMVFGTNVPARGQALLTRVQTVAHARGTHPGLQRGAARTLYTDGDGYVYARGADTDVAIVALNRGSTSRTIPVTIPPDLAAEGTILRDILGGPSVTVTGGMIQVPFTPQGASIWVQ